MNKSIAKTEGMPRQRRRNTWPLTALLAAAFLGACGASSNETATPEPPTSSEAPATTDVVDNTTTEVVEYAATGDETISFIPTCDAGPPLGPGPVTCERVGTDHLVTVANPITKTGTFEGTMLLEATIVLSDTGDYQMSGEALFEGTVAGCGTGTVAFMIENEGNIAQGLTLNSQQTATDGDTGTLGVQATLDYVTAGPVNTLSSGTYSCPQYDEALVVDDAGVAADETSDEVVAEDGVFEGSGTVTFIFSPTCDPGPPLSEGTRTCEQSGDDVVIGLLNPGQRTGAMDGTQEYEGTMTLSPDGSFVTSGTVTFEGTLAGCGTGTMTTSVETEGTLLDGQTVFRETWVADEVDTLRATLLSGAAVETSGSTSNYTITYTC